MVALLLGSCTAAPEPPAAPNPAVGAEFARLLAGRVAGPPVTCIPRYPSQETDVISENTLAIKQGAVVYVSQFRGDCNRAGEPGYALVFRSTTMSGPCENDIAQVVDTGGRFPVGSCVLGPFVPYRLAH
jgi:hypothetical protein